MVNYNSGAALERRVMNYLRTHGWEASRSAGSHGKFDIYAINGDKILLLQAKRRISKRAKEKLNASFEPYCGLKICFAEVVTKDYKNELDDILLENPSPIP